MAAAPAPRAAEPQPAVIWGSARAPEALSPSLPEQQPAAPWSSLFPLSVLPLDSSSRDRAVDAGYFTFDGSIQGWYIGRAAPPEPAQPSAPPPSTSGGYLTIVAGAETMAGSVHHAVDATDDHNQTRAVEQAADAAAAAQQAAEAQRAEEVVAAAATTDAEATEATAAIAVAAVEAAAATEAAEATAAIAAVAAVEAAAAEAAAAEAAEATAAVAAVSAIEAEAAAALAAEQEAEKQANIAAYDQALEDRARSLQGFALIIGILIAATFVTLLGSAYPEAFTVPWEDGFAKIFTVAVWDMCTAVKTAADWSHAGWPASKTPTIPVPRESPPAARWETGRCLRPTLPLSRPGAGMEAQERRVSLL